MHGNCGEQGNHQLIYDAIGMCLRALPGIAVDIPTAQEAPRGDHEARCEENMLEAIMRVTFFAKQASIYEGWVGYDARRIFRPVFNLGGRLFSGSITSNELMYYWNKEYSVCVQFFTIDTPSLYAAIADELVVGKTYNIQMGGNVIGYAVLLDYCYSE